jgi:hypothetical protein
MALVIDKDYNISDARTGIQLISDIYYCDRLVYTLDMLKNKYPNNESIGRISENGLLGIYVEGNYWVFIYKDCVTVVRVSGRHYNLGITTSNLTIPEELCTTKYNNKLCCIKNMIAYVESDEIIIHAEGEIVKLKIPDHDIFVDIFNNGSNIIVLVYINDNKVNYTSTHNGVITFSWKEELITKKNYSYIVYRDVISYIIKDEEVYHTKLLVSQLDNIVDVVGNLLFVGNDGKLYYIDKIDKWELVELDEKYSPYIPHQLQVKSARKN